MALINHTRKFIFIHIPKTAGTSISDFLSQFTMDGDIEISSTPKGVKLRDFQKKLTGLAKHSTSEKVRAYTGEEKWQEYFKFAFVRHPYSRALSMYTFLKRKHRKWSGSEIMDSFGSFNEFVTSDFFQTPGPGKIFNNQVFWLNTEKENLGLDFIGQLESLETHFQYVTSQIMPTNAHMTLPMKNKTSKPSETETIEWIGSLREVLDTKYDLDFQYLPYEKGRF